MSNREAGCVGVFVTVEFQTTNRVLVVCSKRLDRRGREPDMVRVEVDYFHFLRLSGLWGKIGRSRKVPPSRVIEHPTDRAKVNATDKTGLVRGGSSTVLVYDDVNGLFQIDYKQQWLQVIRAKLASEL